MSGPLTGDGVAATLDVTAVWPSEAIAAGFTALTGTVSAGVAMDGLSGLIASSITTDAA